MLCLLSLSLSLRVDLVLPAWLVGVQNQLDSEKPDEYKPGAGITHVMPQKTHTYFKTCFSVLKTESGVTEELIGTLI